MLAAEHKRRMEEIRRKEEHVVTLGWFTPPCGSPEYVQWLADKHGVDIGNLKFKKVERPATVIRKAVTP